ncbi:hypothetical protein F5X68DRAFT_278252 [Plectosphaerella plurivora]|uniref:Uncharacterized protein n=1 Tax=Plectosphaerella plurivora TaxID=936078 RepID=A0A9P8V4P5_9PEZI|nr:hypothetical protein F5X68DRAFT_278252 [Plectosphaerella plurivora]
MPRQLVFCGRRVPRLGARRVSLLLLALATIGLVSLVTTLSGTIPDRYAEHIPKVPMPAMPDMHGFTLPFSDTVLNPFRQPSHPPPRDKNDTFGESSWWADWKWLHVPFSSSLTLDEDRALLPPLKERPPIYCYYDATDKRDAAVKDAESALLLTWRRAWWAQGFRPLILSPAEAVHNPLYKELQRFPDLKDGLRTDLMRWMAWEHMGGGLLAYWTTLPMGPREDPLLSSFRRGEYPALTRFVGLDDGLFAGPKTAIYDAIKAALNGDELKTAHGFLSAAPDDVFTTDSRPKAVAYYSAGELERQYAAVAETYNGNKAKGLRALDSMVNAHLHGSWQTAHPDGIAVLKALPRHSTHMITDAWQLAQDLALCPDTPIPASCPPLKASCKPCSKRPAMKTLTPSRYRNSTAVYTIGTVPHPYTTALLAQQHETIDVPWIRRKSPRDAWLLAVTQELLGGEVGPEPRVLRFKEAVAGDFAPAHSLWLTAEHRLAEEQTRAQLDWHFGFAIPRPSEETAQRPQVQDHDAADGPHASEAELGAEPVLLGRARQVVLAAREGKNGGSEAAAAVAVRAAVEAWSLADTEAWKFARAFLDRRIMERKKWEKEESRYVSGSGSEEGRKKGWAERWSDEGEVSVEGEEREEEEGKEEGKERKGEER